MSGCVQVTGDVSTLRPWILEVSSKSCNRKSKPLNVHTNGRQGMAFPLPFRSNCSNPMLVFAQGRSFPPLFSFPGGVVLQTAPG